MKKRILAMLMAIVALVSCLALSVGAEEVTEEAVVFGLLDDHEPKYHAYYYFTLQAGDAYDAAKLTASAGSVNAAVYIAALNGTYTSGKDAGSVDYSYEYTKLEYKVNASGQILWDCNREEGDSYYFLSVDVQDGHIGAIRNVDRVGAKGARYDSMMVKIGAGYWDGDVYVDNTEVVERFVKELENIGIDVKKSTYGGVVETIFNGFGAAIGGIAGGLKLSFNRILYANGVGGQFSPLVIFIFVMAGFGLATAILYKIFGMVRRRKG